MKSEKIALVHDQGYSFDPIIFNNLYAKFFQAHLFQLNGIRKKTKNISIINQKTDVNKFEYINLGITLENVVLQIVSKL